MEKIILNKKGKILEFSTAISLILIGIGFRFIPHIPNFVPVSAIALFGGVYFSRKTALILPLAVMAISDIFLGRYETGVMISVYGSFLICVLIGFWLKEHKKWYWIATSSLIGAILFFIITNFAVWVFTPWYQKSLQGLIECYVMALPFFRNSLAGDLFYVSVFFGSYELIKVWIKRKFALKEIISSYLPNSYV